MGKMKIGFNCCLIAAILTELFFFFFFEKCFLSSPPPSKIMLYIPHFDLLPWKLKVQKTELGFIAVQSDEPLWPIGLWFLKWSTLRLVEKGGK